VQSELEKLLEVRERDYKLHLSEIPHSLVCESDIETVLRLHFIIPDGAGEPRLRELARMLVTYITNYCFDALKRRDLEESERNELFMQARDLFRDADYSGQAGEMLVYFLIESILKAPQALKKMPITTNTAEERKGSDGVHVRWDEKLAILDILFAESKIFQEFGKALTKAFKSIQDFHDAGGMKEHEMKLVTAHFKILDSDLQAKVISYIDGENAPKTRLTQVCLIGFDWSEYKCLDDSRRKAFTDEFEQRYTAWAQDAVKKIEEGMKPFLHKHLRFEFFLLPFKDVQVFRDHFDEALRGR
jgi:Cap4 SAVED domain